MSPLEYALTKVEASKDPNVVLNFFFLFNNFISFFTNSSNRQTLFKDLQKNDFMSSIHLSYFNPTRWLSRSNVVCALCESLHLLLSLLLYYCKVTEKRKIISIKYSWFKEVHNLKWCILYFFMVGTTLSLIFQNIHVNYIAIQNLIEAEIQSIQKEFILETKINMNAHVCDQEGCSIILNYGPTCGGFFMNWGQICMVKSFKKLSWTKIFQGMNCKELFIF